MKRPGWWTGWRCAFCGWLFPFHAKDCGDRMWGKEDG